MQTLNGSCKILCQNLVVHPKCTLGGSTKFHPCICSEGGWVGGEFTEFDVEFKFAKIQNFYVAEFDVEFKFAKIQNSYVEGGWVRGGSRNLMLSSNLLKSKIPMLRVGGGGEGLRNLMSSNLLKSKIPMLRVGGGGSRNLMLSSNLLKSKVSISMSPPTPPLKMEISVQDWT